eukprot:6189174-Pleurochrysis_carterae.AAC.1
MITSLQPSTHTRSINGACRAIADSFSASRHRLARAAELRCNLPHGLAMCSVLLLLMACITRGDAPSTTTLNMCEARHRHRL